MIPFLNNRKLQDTHMPSDIIENKSKDNENIYCPHCGAKQPHDKIRYTNYDEVVTFLEEYGSHNPHRSEVPLKNGLIALVGKKDELCYYRCQVCNRHYKINKTYTETEARYNTKKTDNQN